MKYVHTLLITILLTNITIAQTTDEIYIQKFAKIAVEEMEIYKIPASITLAQGLLETADGQSELAQNANNHFGIKCKKEWKGQTYRYTDDSYKECFRKYASAKDSYRDHSKFLAERPYYKALFKLDMKDYKAWAKGLKKAGYATNPRYAPLLISLIERFNLNEFDNIKPNQVDAKMRALYPALFLKENEVVLYDDNYIVGDDDVEVPPLEEPTKVDTILHAPKVKLHPLERIEYHSNKKLKHIKVNKGETLSQISKIFDVRLSKLKAYNDIANIDNINANETIFLQKKKSKGIIKTYKVKEGETMRSISQKFGIQLKSLYKRNRMKKGTEAKAGQYLYLKGRKKK